MHIQELVDNVKGKNDVGFVVWLFSCWSLAGILLFIPFWIFMYVIVVLPMALIFEPKNTMVSLVDYIKNKLGIEVNANKKTIINNHIASQENQKQQSKTQKKTLDKHTVNDDYTVDDEIDKEIKNHQENMLCYNLLWLAIITGFVAQFFIKPQYSFSDTMFVCVWLIGFLFSAYSVFVTKQRFRDYNLLFVIIAPFAIIFWSELVFGFFDNKKYYSPKETAEMVSYIKQQEQKKHSNHLINTTIDEMNSKGVENFHKTQIFQNSVEATRQILGDNPSDAQITSHLENMASLMNGNLPIMVDEYTQMFKVTIIGKTVIYNYKVTNIENFVNIPNNAIQEHKNNMMNSNMCANMGHMLKYGVTLSYNYYAVNGDYLFTVDIAPSDCGY